MKRILNIAALAFGVFIIVYGCDKTKPYDVKVAPPVTHFVSSAPFVDYYVRNVTSDSFTVLVGTSDVSGADRNVTFNVSSPSGAVNGTDYTILSPATGNTLVIKAGTAISPIKLSGNFGSYSNGKKDTLVFTLAQPSIPVAKFSDTLKVVLQGYCDVNLAAFEGVYSNAFDTQTGSPNYGPYEVALSSGTVSSTGATTGYIMISNFWDVGGPDIRLDLDWTDPANFKTSVPAQYLYTDSNYGDATITGVGNGTFSSCNNTFTVSYTVTVAAGSFGNFITTIAR